VNSTNPFPGRQIKVFELPNGKTEIIWKHPENTPLERIVTFILSVPFFIYWGYITQGFLRPPIEFIQDFIHFQSERFNIISFILGLLSLLIVIAFFFFCLFCLFYIGIRILLNLVVYVKGTGESKISLNDDELIYQEGQYPVLINNSKNKVLFAEKSSFSEDISINEALKLILKSILDWKFLIFSKAAITFPKQEIQDVQLEYIEERLKLFIIFENKRIAVGKYLYNSEKEWLYKRINRCLNFS